MARPDPLSTYNAKRDFAKTAEPRGKRAATGGNGFIVQKHDATRLHWDFRLEMDGVLKSWAVTRGPSPNPDDKRLAVRTEDHPMSYATFEGTIPKGEYGGGTVMLWDRGTWEPVGGKDPAKTIEEGHVHVILHGERMQGEWLLVRMKPRGGEKRENWLLRKVADAHAGASGDLVDTALTSVATGRSMAEIATGDDPVWHSDAKVARADPEAANPPAGTSAKAKRTSGKAAPRDDTTAPPKAAAKAKTAKAKTAKASAPRAKVPPPFRDVQLATLVDRVPPGSGWLHEVKYDGYRALLAVAGGTVRAYTRHGLDWTDRFAPVVTALAALDLPPALIDGEVVALDDDGRPSFSALQAALKDGGPLHYFAFDLLACDGEDLTALANRDRKARLADLLSHAAAPIHYAEHIESSGEALFDRLCGDGYEGIVSKRADAPYRGTRSRSWLKIKCTRRQEFVILGYLDSDKAGRDLRSLAVGVHDGEALRYAGRVGTGFDAATRDMLLAKLRPLARKTPPAPVPRAAARGVRWVTPRLVAEVAFAEFTADGAIRHASFLGLREDKTPDEVVLETPNAADEVADDAAAPRARAADPKRKPARARRPADDGEAERAAEEDDASPIAPRARRAQPATAPRETRPPRSGRTPDPTYFGVTITNPDRVIYPKTGTTKGELAAYYAAVAEPMLAYVANRPISLVRCPQGRAKHCFFQKHDAGSFGGKVGHVAIREKDGGTADYLVVDTPAALITCVQMGTIEFHGWGAPADDVEHPDRLVFDLDPDEGLDFAAVRDAAEQLRDLLAEMGLQTVPMVTGGKGVHVIAPLDGSAAWPEVKDFASRFARAVAEAHPDRFTANMRKSERKGRIFLDWLRNERGATAVMPWSARARDTPTLAAPVSWDTLSKMSDAVAALIWSADNPTAEKLLTQAPRLPKPQALPKL